MVEKAIVGNRYMVNVDRPSSAFLFKGELVEVRRVEERNHYQSLFVIGLDGGSWYVRNTELDYCIKLLNKGVK